MNPPVKCIYPLGMLRIYNLTFPDPVPQLTAGSGGPFFAYTNMIYRRARTSDDIVPSDLDIPDNYVQHALATTKLLPPVTIHNWYAFIFVYTLLIVLLPCLCR
jgi:hypothetical protein